MSFLPHMKKHLELHATVFMAYTDPGDSIKISECVFWLYTYANSDIVFRFESEGCQGSRPFASFPLVVRALSGPPFTFPTLPCAPGLELSTSASTVSSASSVLALLLIGLVVNLSPYLISPSLILSYLISFSYLIVPFFYL
jgi:hypothetical protein